VIERIGSLQRFLAHAGAVAEKDFRRLGRDLGGIVLLLVVPVVLMAIVGFSLSQRGGSAENDGTQPASTGKPAFGLLVQDRGEYSRHLVALFDNQGLTTVKVTSMEELQAGLVKGSWKLAVSVPPDFSTRIQRGETTSLTVGVGASPTPATWRTVGAVELTAGYLDAASLAGRVSGDFAALRAPVTERLRLRDSVERSVVREVVAKHPPLVSLKVRTISAPPAGEKVGGSVLSAAPTVSVNFFDQVVPGYAVMFALFGISAGAATLLEERKSGTYRRLLVTRASRGSIILGKIAFQFVLTLTQVVVLLGIGAVVFGMTIRLWPMLLVHVVALSFATTAFGMLLVSLVRSSRQLGTMSTMTILGFSAIGGSWWPLWQQPEWIQQVARLSVTYWAMRGFNSIMIFGESAREVAPATLGLCLYGLLAYAVAWARLDRQAQA